MIQHSLSLCMYVASRIILMYMLMTPVEPICFTRVEYMTGALLENRLRLGITNAALG